MKNTELITQPVLFVIALFILSGASQLFASEPNVQKNEEQMTSVPYLGVRVASLSDEIRDLYAISPEKGVIVLQVLSRTPAARAGIRKDDVILAVEGKEVSTPKEVGKILDTSVDTGTIRLTVVREGKQLSLEASPNYRSKNFSTHPASNHEQQDGEEKPSDSEKGEPQKQESQESKDQNSDDTPDHTDDGKRDRESDSTDEHADDETQGETRNSNQKEDQETRSHQRSDRLEALRSKKRKLMKKLRKEMERTMRSFRERMKSLKENIPESLSEPLEPERLRKLPENVRRFIKAFGKELPEPLRKQIQPYLKRFLKQSRSIFDESNRKEDGGFLGIRPDRDSTVEGVVVNKVIPDSPADRIGLQRGDIIRKVNQKPLDSAGELAHRVRSKKPGSSIDLTVERDGWQKTFSVKLGKQPDPSKDHPEKKPERDEDQKESSSDLDQSDANSRSTSYARNTLQQVEEDVQKEPDSQERHQREIDDSSFSDSEDQRSPSPEMERLKKMGEMGLAMPGIMIKSFMRMIEQSASSDKERTIHLSLRNEKGEKMMKIVVPAEQMFPLMKMIYDMAKERRFSQK